MFMKTSAYKFSPHYSPAEIQDGVHCGETGYDVIKRSTGELVGEIFGSEILVDPNDESKGWQKEFHFVGQDGRSGAGSTRMAAIEDAANADCDWCFSTRVIDWQGGEAPCPVCSNGPAEARPVS